MKVTNLRLKFPKEESLVFRDLSFAVSKGEKVLLLGPSGSGKSTLLQVLSGIMPNSIEVPMTAEQIQIPESWGIVFQDPDTQFCMPHVDEELAFVLENLNVPREQMEAKIKQALAQVGLHFENPHVLITELSQGMKQRLALASVLLLQPDVLFLDEPSALLDPEGTNQIWEAVKESAAEKTVVIVEHKIDQISDWVDRIVLFNNRGEIIGEGSPKTVFSTYEKELQQFGIWYPGVWNTYLSRAPYQEMLALRQQEIPQTNQVLRIDELRGFRGTTEKISANDLTVRAGEWITIVGENGAGKTTLLLAIMQLIRTTGKYVVNGVPVQIDAKKRKTPEGISFVFQNPELQFVMNTIYDELALSYRIQHVPRETIDEQVLDLIQRFQLPTNLERHPFQLSIGQKRRLSVATALSEETAIIVLDEPTFGQDAVNTFAMLESLETLRKEGKTILMVSHDPEIVRHYSTRIWTISEGRVINDEVMQHV